MFQVVARVITTPGSRCTPLPLPVSVQEDCLRPLSPPPEAR